MKNSAIAEDRWATHASHCCKVHGCKYGERKCPVVLGLVQQEYACEFGTSKNPCFPNVKDSWDTILDKYRKEVGPVAQVTPLISFLKTNYNTPSLKDQPIIQKKVRARGPGGKFIKAN